MRISKRWIVVVAIAAALLAYCYPPRYAFDGLQGGDIQRAMDTDQYH